MFGKPTVGASEMLAVPANRLDSRLKVLVSEEGESSVSVSYNLPEVPGRAISHRRCTACSFRPSGIDRRGCDLVPNLR